MQTLDRLNTEGKVDWLVRVNKNSLKDEISGLSPTVTSDGLTFVNSLQGRGIRNFGTGDLLWAPAANGLSGGGVVYLFGNFTPDNNQFFVQQRDPGPGLDWQFFYLSNSLTVSVVGASSSFGVSLDGSERSLAVKFESTNAAPTLYVNGKAVATGSVSLAPPANTQSITLMGSKSVNTRNATSLINIGVIFNDPSITEDEIAALHEEFMQSRGATLTEIRNPVFNKKSMFGGDDATIRYDFQTFAPDGSYLDLTSNGDDGAYTSLAQGKRNNIYGHRFFGRSSQAIESTNNSALSNVTQFSRRLIFNINDWSSNGTVFNVGSNAITLSYLTGGTLRVFLGGSGTFANYSIGQTEGILDVIVDYDGSEPVANDRVKLYLNGELLTAASTSGTFPATTQTFTAKEQLGALNNTDFHNGNIFLSEAYNTPQGVNALSWYKKWNKNLIFKTLMENVPPTTATISSGSPIPFTPWSVKQGSFSVIEANDSKYLSAQTGTSAASMFGEGHFGTHVFEINKVADGTNALFFFGMKNTDLYTTTGQTGYVIQIEADEDIVLKRCNAASLPVLGTASLPASLDTYYKFAVTRGRDGAMVVYAKGGAYTDWTEIITATDTNYTQGNCYQVYQTAVTGSYYRFIGYYSTPLTIDQLPN